MRKIAFALMFVCGTAVASTDGRFNLDILLNDQPRPEYAARGAVYIEAIRGESYAIRITNPMSYRVAVALAVDGLNTIDARHTEAWPASKWILDPHESTVIPGWQTSGQTAREFFFTTERDSYAAHRGHPENLGVIEAVVYRERPRMVERLAPSSAQSAPSAKGAAPSGDYAGTGMGDRVQHDVQTVDIDLDPTPIATVRIRYEFHSELVRLGVLPSVPSPLERRERARGFENYCPEMP